MNVRAFVNRFLYRIVLPFRRQSLRNRDVSIISNDCYSSFMYRFYHIPFNSPFVGLFIMPDDYLSLLENPSLIEIPPRMTVSSRSRFAAVIPDSAKDYPLGLLPGGIEIHFLHYATVDEAYNKWTRRVPRINWQNCIVKFSQNNGCTEEHLRRFDALPYSSKVMFTTEPHPDLACAVALPEFAGEAQLGKYWKNADLRYNFCRHANAILDGRAGE